MHIRKITIKNFRSVENVTVSISKIADKYCSIFLGMNESGKSNIFKAIALLDSASKHNYDIDCNKSAKKNNDNIEIIYELGFDNYNSYKKKFEELGIPKAIVASIDIYKVERKITIDFQNERKDFVWLWMRDKPIFKNYLYFEKESKFVLLSSVYKGDDKLTKENLVELVGEGYDLTTARNIETHLESRMYSMIDNNIPKPIVWRPSPEYLINEPVDLEAFVDDDSISVPLRNIFSIAGIDDVKKRLKRIADDDKEERRQLEEELTTSITNYINKVWAEHRINIIVDIESMMCSVMIEDKDDHRPKYRMEQRSDGFKQFVSILLSLSIESSTSQIKNRLILLDEPEIHLHPSGVRYLRGELLRISANNLVLIATHSIYMVDKQSLERHFKVDKELSKTSIKQIDKNNPYQEEVVYEALGTSVYEHIKPNMMVFEGKTDKDIFDAFTNKFRMDLKPKSIGSISADGVEKIPQYTKFFDGAFVKGYVVVDSDKDGVRIKEQVKKSSPSFNSKNTFDINDLIGGIKELTLEDLYPIVVITDVIRDKYKLDIELTNSPVVKQLELKSKATQGKLNVKELKGELVNYIINDINKLTKGDCKKKYPMYYKYLSKLHLKV